MGKIDLFTEPEAEAFCTWFLRESVTDVRDEYDDDDEWAAFNNRRIMRLQIQLDDLRTANFDSPITTNITSTYYRIVNTKHPTPLSSEGSFKSNTRFNYKNSDDIRNRVIYFGQDKRVCYMELFYMAIQEKSYKSILETFLQEGELKSENPIAEGDKFDPSKSELEAYKYKIYEYDLDIQNVLVLTSDSTFQAMGISHRVTNNEWFSINDEFQIPTAGQLIATSAKNRGFNGILYSSVRHQSKQNLVLFEKNVGELKLTPKNIINLDHSDFLDV